ncbi:Uncharacterised protein [Vibrio cholerae]|nr:Uncharacterised protein [Vibrio cholerae]CSI64492.1 Uncharacterised protein [Vibrio cholerae]
MCIQLLSTRIQNADKLVPTATSTVDSVCNHSGTRPRPNSITPRNVASIKKAVITS